MLLVISHSEQDYQAIRSVVPENAGPVRLAQTAREGLAFLSSYPVEVVVCERDLPDGDWRGILSATWHLPKPPLLIVISRHADESLWAEVLNLGGYDVLLKPFYRDELVRVIQQAFRCGSVVRGRAKATSAA